MKLWLFSLVPVVGLAIFYQVNLAPKFQKLGVTKKATPQVEYNTASCKAIPELVACEDQFIHRASGFSYLPCSTNKARSLWVPAMLMLDLNKTSEAALPSDEIKLFNTNTHAVDTVTITNRPAHLEKLHLHGIEGYSSNDIDMTFFINNHGVPTKGVASKVGADSTIEVFSSKIGSTEWKWIKSVKHDAILTPNNIVAVDHDKFYVTNDHPAKIGLRRQLTLLEFPGGESGIVFCDISGSQPQCKSVAEGFYHPNGLTKGPGRTIYHASTFMSTVTQFEIQSDYSLSLVEEIPVNFKDQGILDNIAVDDNGSIICPIIVSGIAFGDRARASGVGSSPAMVWKITNNTQGDGQYYGEKYKREMLFSDPDGRKVAGVTNAQVYKDKLYITGLTSDSLVVCDAKAN